MYLNKYIDTSTVDQTAKQRNVIFRKNQELNEFHVRQII